MKASIIIPAFNAEKTILPCLQAVCKQAKEAQCEVIVVNDGSSDQTVKMVTQFKGVKLVNQANQGPAAARNKGAQLASGSIIVFLDSDCVPSKNWLKKMLAPFENAEIVGVQGRYENALNNQWLARFIQFEIEERYSRMEKKDRIDFIGSYSAAYRKNIFDCEGGFDEQYRAASGEDSDLSFRLAEKGYRLVFMSEARVRHFHPLSLVKYWKTKFFRAYWRVRMYQKNPQKMWGDSYTNPRIKVQMFFCGLVGLWALLSIFFMLFGGLPVQAFSEIWNLLPFLFLIGIVLFSLPTVFFIGKKEAKLGIAGILLLPVNAFLFTTGYLYGLLKLQV